MLLMNYFLLILSFMFFSLNVYSTNVDSIKSELNFLFYYIEGKNFDENSVDMINHVFNTIPENQKNILLAFDGSNLISFNNKKEELNSKNYLIDSIKIHSNYYSYENEKEIVNKTKLLNNISELFKSYLFNSNDLNDQIKYKYQFHFLVDLRQLNLLINNESKILELFNNTIFTSLIDVNNLKSSIYLRKRDYDSLKKSESTKLKNILAIYFKNKNYEIKFI